MITEKLNNLAIKAKNGCTDSIDELCRYYLPRISRLSEGIWYKVNNEASFECYCILKIKRLIKRYDIKKGSFDNLVRRGLRESVSWFLIRGKSRERLKSLDEPIENPKNGSRKTIDPPDDYVDIESNVISKEIIALLAQGDKKKEIEFILSYWSDGFTNDTKLSELLAQRFGGKPRSYCKYIQRFREKSQLILEKSGYIK